MNFQNKTGYLIEMYGGRSIVAFIALIFNLAIVYVTLVKKLESRTLIFINLNFVILFQNQRCM